MDRVLGGNIPSSANVIEKSSAAADQMSVREAMLTAIPDLRAFAVSLCGSYERGDDLVQETLLRALPDIHLFSPGNNMMAWLFTILRNHFFSDYRKRRHETEYKKQLFISSHGLAPEQYGELEYDAFRSALMQLPAQQREALILIAASGISQEEAAEICGCAVRTIRSRVHRARRTLEQLMLLSKANELRSDGNSLPIAARYGKRPHLHSRRTIKLSTGSR
jgi:RNA polymerase sigma-70 factor, ECF subfamily